MFSKAEWEWICALKENLTNSGYEAAITETICIDRDEAESAIAKVKVLLESMELILDRTCNATHLFLILKSD